MFLAFDTEFVTGGNIFFEKQWAGSLLFKFLAPAKLPRSAILNNFVDKIVTAIKKSLKLLLYLRNPSENGVKLSKCVYNPWNTCYTIFQTDVKVTVFC